MISNFQDFFELLGAGQKRIINRVAILLFYACICLHLERNICSMFIKQYISAL